MINDVYEGICKVARSCTDFYSGYDVLFAFMCDHPEARTTKEFMEYHISYMRDPRLPDGRPEFSYLIGKHFHVEDWVNEEDMYAFHEYIKLIE